ncbi:MAG: hypothetical protein EOO47_22490 [Flavobacterium sp.]|nr:MAG: hypothetical protein EOO47_22490 [Flavobacterium sp.]
MIDAYWHKEEKIPKESIEGLETISLDYDLHWSPTNKKLSLADSKGNLLSEISLQTLDNEGTDLRYNSATSSLELYNADNELLNSISVADFVKNVGTQLALNSDTLQLKDSQGNILSSVQFNVSNVNNLQTLLDSKLDKPTMTTNYVGKWDGSNFSNGILQDNGDSAGIGNTDYKNIIWAVDSTKQAALVAPRMNQVQRLAITLDTSQAGAIVYQTDKNAGYYLWNGTSWQTLGENIATADLTNNQARIFTQNANFTWDTLGNPYYLKGLTDQTKNLTQYNKVLRIDPVTKQVEMGDSFDVAVTIPDNLTITAPAMNVNYTVNHVYPNPVSPLPQNLIDLKKFMATIATNQYIQIDDKDLIIQKVDTANRVTISNGIVRFLAYPDAQHTDTPLASANSNITMPHDKNWVFIVVPDKCYHIVYTKGGRVGFARTNNTDGVQSPEIGTLMGDDNSYGWVDGSVELNVIKGQQIKPTIIYTKVGEVLNISVAYSDGTIYSRNTDALTFLGDYRFVMCMGSYNDQDHQPSFSNIRYYIEA